MSADNGTYILQTYGPEFRVAHTQNIDEVYGEWDETKTAWKGDASVIKELFSPSKVYTEIEEAHDVATEIDNSYEFSEYGVCLIRDFSDRTFEDLTKENEDGKTVSA